MPEPVKIKIPDVTIKFDPQSRRLLFQLLERLDTLIPLLIKEHADAAQEQDSDVQGGSGSGD
jgi:hypothetical protein